MKNYNREKKITLPVSPSPNLPNEESIELYPSLCLFEGTNVSIGRGTPWPFQIYGAPYFKKDIYSFHFIPQANSGSKEPPQKGKLCYGEELKGETLELRLQLKWLIQAYQNAKTAKESEKFFNSFFEKLIGTGLLRKQIEQGLSEKEIRASWQEGLKKFRKIREKYLIYN